MAKKRKKELNNLYYNNSYYYNFFKNDFYAIGEPSCHKDASVECRSALRWILSQVDQKKAATWADRLIDTFGSLANTLAADKAVLTKALKGSFAPAHYLYCWNLVMIHSLKCEIRYGSILDNWNEIISYLKLEMGQLKIEQIRVLFFDTGYGWIGNEVLATGTISEVQCYPREVARRAVISYASGAVLVHNHPTGNPKMSKEDVSMTYKVEESCHAVGVKLFDHLVICRDSYSSFREDNPLWAISK